MKRISVLLLPLVFTLACDSAEETVEERSGEDPASELAVDEPGPDPHGHERGQAKLDKLCAEIECSDAQREAIADLLADARGPRPDHDARKAEFEALATAFRADTLDLAALPQPPEPGEHKAELAKMIVGLHDLLTPEQRETIATKIEQDGPMAFLGHHGPGHHGKRGGKHGKRGDVEGKRFDPAAKAERKVERLCGVVSCSEEQSEALTTIFTDHVADKAPRERPEPDTAALASFADAFRAEQLDAATVEGMLDAMRPQADARPNPGELLVAVHGVLTPEQRDLLADKMLEEGPRALLGGKRHGKRGHRRG